MDVRSQYTVVGMTCGHRVSAVTEELTGLPGVRDVQVEFDTGTATVDSDDPLPLDEARVAVDEARYTLEGDPFTA